jgi:hypothetical protein
MPASDQAPGRGPGGARPAPGGWDDPDPWEDAEEWDPDCSPPAGYEDVPLRELFAEAAERAARYPGEAVPDGFLPRGVRSGTPSSGPAGGFASGGPLDTAPPELAVLALAEEAAGPDGRGAGVSADEVVGLVRFWGRAICRDQARRLAWVAQFIRLRPAPGARPARGGGDAGRVGEVYPG